MRNFLRRNTEGGNGTQMTRKKEDFMEDGRWKMNDV